MSDPHDDPTIKQSVSQIRSVKEELEVLLEEFDERRMTDFSQFLCIAEDLSEYAAKVDKQADKLSDDA